ncbi:hypothetical protein C8Q80DRAFT_1153421 [Daedaleopsis nitida]|nr:hypothetical protein C8Q80DRAFT_1153421 [Daedaleopsis nitida]
MSAMASKRTASEVPSHEIPPTKSAKTEPEEEPNLMELLDTAVPGLSLEALVNLNQKISTHIHARLNGDPGAINAGTSILIVHDIMNMVDTMYWPEDILGLLGSSHLDHLMSLVTKGWQSGDWSEILKIKYLQRPFPSASPDTRRIQTAEAPEVIKTAIEQSWTAPFIGHWHTVLADNLREMYRRASPHTIEGGDKAPPKYLAHTTIIQSSGSGKSRLVDEAADTIFTIPCDIREEDQDGAWPHADTDARVLLVRLGTETVEYKVHCNYLRYLQALFQCTDMALEKIIEQYSQETHRSLASYWWGYLARDNNRKALYEHVGKTVVSISVCP